MWHHPLSGVVEAVKERFLKKLYFGIAADPECTDILEVGGSTEGEESGWEVGKHVVGRLPSRQCMPATRPHPSLHCVG
jgi:hypothetical protein